jgi:hypothetical protein
MTEDNEATELANRIKEAVDNPEAVARRIQKKAGGKKGIFRIILDFIKSYFAKDPKVSDEDWLAGQFAKPEYADAFKGENAAEERLATAKGIVQGVEDYENAKKSLRYHKDSGGSRESWLAEQINIGAANNNMDPAEYAAEIARGLDDAIEENARFVFDDKEAE